MYPFLVASLSVQVEVHTPQLTKASKIQTPTIGYSKRFRVMSAALRIRFSSWFGFGSVVTVLSLQAGYKEQMSILL